METLGTVYGGWSVPEHMSLNRGSVVYSGGVGEDISFDIKLQAKYDCNILLIDPTVKAIRHFDEVKQYYKQDNFQFTGNIQDDYVPHIQFETPNMDKFEYVNMGLWDQKDTLKFYRQTNDKYVSQSLIPNMFGTTYDEVNVNSIKGMMNERCHSKIDLLKLDIEGAEIKVLNQMLDDCIFPKYVLVEFDLWLKRKDPSNETKNLVERFLRNHYEIVANDNCNITFVKTDI